MDAALTLLAAAANAGQACPQISLLAGSSLFVGTPASHDRFEEASERQIAESIYYSMKPTKPTMESAYREATVKAASLMTGIRNAIAETPEPSSVITLRDVEVWPASGEDGVQLPVVRVPLSSVDSWWTGSGKRLKAGSGGFFFGVVAPLPEA